MVLCHRMDKQDNRETLHLGILDRVDNCVGLGCKADNQLQEAAILHREVFDSLQDKERDSYQSKSLLSSKERYAEQTCLDVVDIDVRMVEAFQQNQVDYTSHLD